MGDFYFFKRILQWEILNFGVRGTKVPKGTPLRQIWSNKSYGVFASSVVLTPRTVLLLSFCLLNLSPLSGLMAF